mgnify:CR=1 FL=1|tara:strand:- start:358 stop:552 length:195 start_codon:yes stop_codon:yes gene_type:complete
MNFTDIINSNSAIEVTEAVGANNDYYFAKIDDKILVKIGDVNLIEKIQWELIKSRTGLNIWVRK